MVRSYINIYRTYSKPEFMTAPRVLCLGEILYDTIAEDLDTPLEKVKSWTSHPGGAPANAACGLAKLGTPSAFIGAVGADEPGRELVSLLESLKVDTAGIQYHPTAPTRRVFVTREANGERHFAGFGGIPTGDFADTKLNYRRIPENLFDNARFLVTGTLGLAYPDSRSAIHHAIDLAKARGLKVFVDINWRSVFWEDESSAPKSILELLSRADIVKCSDTEAEWLFHTGEPEAIHRDLPHLQGILLTAGEKGCKYYLGGNTGYIPAFKVDSIDTTGAGDGFSAGFLHQCCHPGDIIFYDADSARTAITYASAVGAIVTTKLGAISAQPTASEVLNLIASH